ncbi:MAG TPA: NF038129 family PEP-CTERM protein [Telluria sp.]|nr:NF038129 family PEP-CTERM protein [Telluria sp.]
MFKLSTLFSRALLALALACGAGAALAGPTYQVTVNTSALAGANGYLDFGFQALGSAAPAFATLSNFTGALGAAVIPSGDVVGTPPGMVTIGNTTGFNDLLQAVSFGGLFTFDLSFTADDGIAGSTFSVALVNDSVTDFVGYAGNIVEIALQPGAATTVNAVADFASVNAVPEPSDLLLMMSGLAVMGWVARRKAGAAR